LGNQIVMAILAQNLVGFKQSNDSAAYMAWSSAKPDK